MANYQIKTLKTNESRKHGVDELWIGVLARAAEDALKSEEEDRDCVRRVAQQWFRSYSVDFRLVCELAGRNPVYVQEKMMPKINERRQSMTEVREKYGTRFTKTVYKFNKGEWVNEHQPQSNM